MNKDARAIRDAYSIPYSTALRWVRELGLEAAIAKAEQTIIDLGRSKKGGSGV